MFIGEVMKDENLIDDVENDNDLSFMKRRTFVEVDRKQENKDVTVYQISGDNRLFEKMYKIRIPTLQIWARKYRYLMDSQEDLFSEFSFCFTKAVMTYKKGRGSFNTWLFSLLMNHVRNLQTSRRAKKRLPEGMNPNLMSKFMYSLDYCYGGDDDSENTLKDILASKHKSESKAVDNMVYNEIVSKISNDNPIVKGFLHKLSLGNTVSSLLKEYRTKTGSIKINKNILNNIRSSKDKELFVSDIIRNNSEIDSDFMVVDYDICHKSDNLKYTIEMKKTNETDVVIKALRRMKKDKDIIMAKIC